MVTAGDAAGQEDQRSGHEFGDSATLTHYLNQKGEEQGARKSRDGDDLERDSDVNRPLLS